MNAMQRGAAMNNIYQHLGIYSDLVSESVKIGPLYPSVPPGKETQESVRRVLHWGKEPAFPKQVQVEDSQVQDGLQVERISWKVGYGPRTQAWLFKPVGITKPLPAVLALHDHGGFKYIGKEKIADGPEGTPEYVQYKRRDLYGGRAWVNALAREGFAVLVHDVFLWGSRRFPREVVEIGVPSIPVPAEVVAADWSETRIPAEISEYNYLAVHHEHVVAKYLNLLGTNLAGVVCYEDRLALNYLASRPDVEAENLACMGLSGGGARAGLLRATSEILKAAVVVGMMSTYPALLDRHVECHTWMFFPTGWARLGDWPDLVACRAPGPLLVQYDLEDDLFPLGGMRAAHDKLTRNYEMAGAPEAYVGQFFPGPHKFDQEMQAAAFSWLRTQLKY
jgi:dienelactone hydrolase